jgi:hypothetical protein
MFTALSMRVLEVEEVLNNRRSVGDAAIAVHGVFFQNNDCAAKDEFALLPKIGPFDGRVPDGDLRIERKRAIQIQSERLAELLHDTLPLFFGNFSYKYDAIVVGTITRGAVSAWAATISRLNFLILHLEAEPVSGTPARMYFLNLDDTVRDSGNEQSVMVS